MPRLLWAVPIFLPAVIGCSSAIPDPSLALGPAVSSEGLAACAEDGLDGKPHDGYRCVTYRGIAGVSMGGGAALRIGLQHSELFDVLGSMGSPYLDMEYFYNSVAQASAGGFCPMEQLLAHLDEIDQKDNPNVWCGPVAFGDLALPGTTCGGFSGDYNHQYRGTSAGRGGSFNRESSFEIVFDLALAGGNPAFYNPSSPYLPPGVPAAKVVPLELSADDRFAEREAKMREICASPVVLEHFYDGRYNPRGEYPVISFCDGDGPTNGEYEPDTFHMPMEVTLAVDYNRNGRRDYGEPVLGQTLELFKDVGVDGLADPDEPGYDPVSNPDPNGDDYDWLDHPAGTEHNWRYDPGEPFDDFGLDGVPGTADFGEMNGRWDANPNLVKALEQSPRKLLQDISDRMLGRLQIWADAGIRDFLYTSQITNQLWGVLHARRPDTALYTDWEGLRQTTGPAGAYDPELADLTAKTIGRHAYLRYGDPSVCPDIDWVNGRGNHVGPAWEVLHRLRTVFAFASARFANGDFTVYTSELSQMGGPTGGIADYVQVESFPSTALGRAQPYVVVLPPDYYLGTTTRYPVLYFLHGQGQKATDLAASALLFLGPMMAAHDARAGSRWQKMIVVFADGECHPGECHTGTFYTDFLGFDGNGLKHGEAFFELMRTVEGRYRVKAPEMIPIE